MNSKSERKNLKESVLWEEFFIRIGCNVPLLNAQAMDLKLNHSPLFPFIYYESGTLCEKAENILNQQHESTIKFLSLQIKMKWFKFQKFLLYQLKLFSLQ